MFKDFPVTLDRLKWLLERSLNTYYSLGIQRHGSLGKALLQEIRKVFTVLLYYEWCWLRQFHSCSVKTFTESTYVEYDIN